MAGLPKKRQTKASQLARRRQIKLKLPSISPCKSCGKPKKPHWECTHCGKY